MKRTMLITYWALFSAVTPALHAAEDESFPVTDEWKSKIRKLAPAEPSSAPASKRKVLVFSLTTGFQHRVIPHTAAVVEILGTRTGAFTVAHSKDVSSFKKENLQPFDAVVLNNNCSKGGKRDLFFDVLGDADKAAELERNLIGFVANGGGLIVIHGAIVMQNNSQAFSDMVGGSFDFHPRQQEVICNPVDPKHDLVKAFQGESLVHVDEPYLFRNAYAKKNFRPLLVMDTSKLDCGKRTQAVHSDVRYVSWIKKHGKGRVFYCSPSHNAQSFENPRLLRFLLDGIQYTLGDLECDDSPMKQ